MKKWITLLGLVFTLSLSSQEVACSDLVDFIEQNGWRSSSVSSYEMNSSWLHRVTMYTYDFKNYVVAEIKESEYSYRTRKYIFCDVPSYNWSSFRFGGYGDTASYGERFHKYIFDYKCYCY